MSLFLANGNGVGGRTLYTNPTKHHQLPSHPQLLPLRKSLHLLSASKKVSSSSRKIGRFDGKNRRNPTATTDQEDGRKRKLEMGDGVWDDSVDDDDEDDGFVMPELPGEAPDFWEGEQWEALGFFVQYMWAFGILFAVIACGIAVVTYNEGATDFKQTPVYKEAIQSEELLEEPDASNSDVFESNPTEEAPSLD